MFNFYNKFEKYSKNFKSLGFNYGQKNGLSLLLLYIAKKKNFDISINAVKELSNAAKKIDNTL